jgi:hypothetical protein
LRPSFSSVRPSTPSMTITRGRSSLAWVMRWAKSLSKPLKSCGKISVLTTIQW